MEDLFIREALSQDLQEIYEIEQACFGEEQFSLHQLRYLITKAKGCFWVVESNQHVIAYVCFLSHALRSNLRLYSIAVHPDRKGEGIATLLLDKGLVYARKMNYKSMTLEVDVRNLAAISLYEKKLFQIVRVLPSYYSENRDAFYMELTFKV